MSQIKEYIKIAIMNIRHNKGRSVLTMLGIIIGISSVIMVLSIGGGVSDEVNSALDGIGGGQVSVYADSTRKDITVAFDESDMKLIEERVDHVKGVSPSYNMWGSAVGPKGENEFLLTAAYEAYQYSSKEKMAYGHYFTKEDVESENLVCVIDESSAKMLFGTTDVVGLSFEMVIWGISQEVKIVGVRATSTSSIVNMMNGSGYVQAEMPLSTACSKFGLYYGEFNSFMIYGEGNQYCSDIAKQAKSLLESKYDVIGENQIQIQSFSDYTSEFSQIMSIITLFVSLVAAISLLVGGIGVMNIMLVSVTERTREIGIRKSLGARTNSIMLQFLAEAGIMTLIGGIIGIVIGVVGAEIICSVAGITASISAGVVIATTLFSCGIGVFFGIYPAKRAAKLRPIDALRHE